MNKTRILTLAVLAAALAMALLRRGAAPARETSAPPEPQDTIYAMFNAARAGEVASYLATFTDPMAATLRQALAETTESEFKKNLRGSYASVKGIAVSSLQQTADTEGSVRVEYVYQDRNESQMMYLAKTPAGWKISRTEADQRIAVPVPYGTRVR